MASLESLIVDPEEYRKKLALGLIQSGTDTSPIRSWTQGAARMAQALVGGLQLRDLQGQQNISTDAQRIAIGLPPIGQASQQPPFSQTSIQQPQPQIQQQNQVNQPTISASGQNLPSFYPQYKQVTAMQESGGSVSPPPTGTSSARTKYQFLKGDWADLMKQDPSLNWDGWLHPEQYPDQAERAMDIKSTNIAKSLQTAGLPTTPGNMYMGHFLGYSGGPDFLKGLKQNPNVPATALVSPAAAMANQSVFFNKDGTARTAQQVYDLQTGKFGSILPNAGQTQEQIAQSQFAPFQPSRAMPQYPSEVMTRLNALLRPNATPGEKAAAEILVKQYQTPREQYLPVTNAQGQIIGQRSTLTNKMEPYTGAQQIWQPVTDNQGRKYAESNILTGETRAMPESPELAGAKSFESEAGKVDASTFQTFVKAGNDANTLLGNLNALKVAGDQAKTGVLAPYRNALQAVAEQFGIDTSEFGSVGDAQAMKGLAGKIAYSLRPTGIQIRSNFEVQQLVNQIPGLSQTPEGRSILIDTFGKFAQRQLQEADIADKALGGEITRSEARKQIRSLGPAISADEMKQIQDAAKGVSNRPEAKAAPAQPQAQPAGAIPEGWSVTVQ